MEFPIGNTMTSFNIVFPCYNVAHYIDACLDSIAASCEKDYQVFCVDDCSTDNTFDILKHRQKQDSRIVVRQNEKIR
jgi:glycosyltransferase involved in cell wall biosynthesis